MNSPYAVLPGLPLQPGTGFGPRTKPLTIVRMDSPAVSVMTDFATVTPVTIDPEIPIDLALAKMKTAAVRLLFVVNEVDEIIGLVTARDILGERPIKITEETRTPRSSITVADIMTPQSRIQVLDAARVEEEKVGDIVTTLRVLERQHALVATIDPATGQQHVTGMFSTTHIGRLLGHDFGDETVPAHSLAEIVEKMA
jgi:CBS domain-containing protein